MKEIKKYNKVVKRAFHANTTTTSSDKYHFMSTTNGVVLMIFLCHNSSPHHPDSKGSFFLEIKEKEYQYFTKKVIEQFP